MHKENEIIKHDSWEVLKKHTAARIALGKTGVSVPTKPNLAFKLAHALARDAVYNLLDKNELHHNLELLHLPFLFLQSCAINKKQYLQRPDFGRKLNQHSIDIINKEDSKIEHDICINIADGLSADAINKHAIPLINLLIPMLKEKNYSIAPICVIEQGRVAISDETGFLFNSKISIILIGERPGLSATDSLGVYITYNPRVENNDALRNCISNIRPEGLVYEIAAKKIATLINEAMRLKMTGVGLKEHNNFITD
ncbi:MAG: ethanolamine ammonia-lyase subunit EutC [Sphingobacteriales bacterium]|nr:ethanolamine ammonia-lyase subunit EutC [Sphingobacteriales bacterium]